MDLDGQNVHISLPPAQVMHISIDEDTLNEESFVYSQDGWNKNPVTAAEQTAAIQQAQLQMEETVQSNAALLASAQNRAKSLIENYIRQLGQLTGTDYQVTWVYQGGQPAESAAPPQEASSAA